MNLFAARPLRGPSRPHVLLAGGLLTAAAASAQQVASTAKEEAVTLSPFEVSADTDTGYAATNTLAGTRLNTPVKDLGASLSILTKDFITRRRGHVWSAPRRLDVLAWRR